jgi:hypothetical protein
LLGSTPDELDRKSAPALLGDDADVADDGRTRDSPRHDDAGKRAVLRVGEFPPLGQVLHLLVVAEVRPCRLEQPTPLNVAGEHRVARPRVGQGERFHEHRFADLG